MALHTIGTKATSSLISLAAWSTALLAADMASIGQGIAGDGNFGANATPSAGQKAVLATGNTHTNTTLDSLSASPATPALTQIHVGDMVLGPGIAPGTFVAVLASGTSVTLSKAATATASGVNVAFIRYVRPMFDPIGILEIPGGRGRLKVLAGDYVVVDPVTGWPILLSGNEVSYAGSVWTFT